MCVITLLAATMCAPKHSSLSNPDNVLIRSVVWTAAFVAGGKAEVSILLRNTGPSDIWAPRRLSMAAFVWEDTGSALSATVVSAGPALEFVDWLRLRPGGVSMLTIAFELPPGITGDYGLKALLVADPSDDCKRQLGLSGLLVVDRLHCDLGTMAIQAAPASRPASQPARKLANIRWETGDSGSCAMVIEPSSKGVAPKPPPADSPVDTPPSASNSTRP